MTTAHDEHDPASVDPGKVTPKAGLAANFETPAYPPLLFSTKSRVWGDKTPSAVEPTEPEFINDGLKGKTLAKDGQRCMFCGFFAQNHEVHNVSDNHRDVRAENLRATDPLCHGWQHLAELGDGDAVIAYLPGLAGQDVNHLQRTIQIALVADDAATREDARKLLNWLASHRDYAQAEWGTYEPAAFGEALARASDEDREKRQVSFAGLAVVFHPERFGRYAKAWASNSSASQTWREIYCGVMNAPA